MAEEQRVRIPKAKLGTQGLDNDPVPEEVGIAVIKEAFNRGIPFFDISDVYGPFTNEIVVGKAKEVGGRGKIKYIGISEANPDTIRRAHSVHPITALQMEWSLWTPDIEKEIVPLFRPLVRGFFRGKAVVESLAANTLLVWPTLFQV
ncbi:Aldo/keto reductase/potassium channel subunit beta [Parasponia andersonii]|uniref:Aldo/keto reductase/potassium channel subunit beta n=1 Tax=Parasponia andersonii TaxID=3476 RepID=A0A2P5DKN2_PARAD|nr:Aldo/keto reductase/potassium channel subunit beta [Parasponia andersonii]